MYTRVFLVYIFLHYINTWQSRRIRLPEDDAGALERVGILTIYI